ncbi:serine/threonine protein kinase [Streptomyces sp. NPDC102360]|uniref:serine/threonine protein kinase n=1 Tax=Streptomyces sp. NPDC102360 TaxID=3366160 RepID=UPI0038120C6E
MDPRRNLGVQREVWANREPGNGGFRPLDDKDPRTVGGYRLVAGLGSGGMGRVYLSHTPGGRAVAVKVIRPELAEDPEFRRRFRTEVAAASKVHGLYTAPVVDSDTESPVPWCATAYVPGPSLAEAVREHGPLPVDTVLRMTAGIAEALQAVHDAGIVHRDLKPSNVLLASDGPRVIDFGVARAADATSVTRSGAAVGTVAYMAPEQVLGGSSSGSADVFALGQTAVFAATGGTAYGEGDPHAVLYRVVHEEPDLSKVPDTLRELIAGCLTKSAEDRPTVQEVIETVQVIREAQPGGPGPATDAWLPGELAEGIAVRAEGARVTGAESTGHATPPRGATGAPATPGSPAPAGVFGPPVAFAQEAQDPPGAAVQQGHPATAPDRPSPGSPAALSGAETAAVSTEPRRKRPRAWLLAVAGVVLVACGAAAALYFVPGDGPRDSAGGQVATSAPGAKGSGAKPASPSKSASPSAATSPRKSGGAAAPAPSGAPDDGATAAPPSPGASEPETSEPPAPSTYNGIVMADGQDLLLSDEPVRARADDGQPSEDLTYDVYENGAKLSPGTGSGSTLAPLPADQPATPDACRDAQGAQDFFWVYNLSVGQRLCLVSGSGDIGLLTLQGKTEGKNVTLDAKVWRAADQ